MIERRPWLGLARQEARTEDALPARLLEPGAVTLPLAGIGEAPVLARRIEAATGIPVRFVGPARAGEDSSRHDSPAGFGIDLLSPDGGVWTGPLDALLDAWTEPAGYAWRYDADAGAIEIVRREAVAFRIHALAGRQRYEASGSTDDGASGGDEGGGVSTRQSIAAETDYDPWPEIEAQAAALAGPGTRGDGGAVVGLAAGERHAPRRGAGCGPGSPGSTARCCARSRSRSTSTRCAWSAGRTTASASPPW